MNVGLVGGWPGGWGLGRSTKVSLVVLSWTGMSWASKTTGWAQPVGFGSNTVKSISSKAPRLPHPAWEKAAGNVDAAIAGAGPGGPVSGLLILLARQAWDTSFTKQQRKELQPPWLQPAPEHMPVCKHSGQQDRSRFDNTFGLNRQCKTCPWVHYGGPRKWCSTWKHRDDFCSKQSLKHHVILYWYPCTLSPWGLASFSTSQISYHFQQFEDLLKIFISQGFSLPASMQTNNQIVGSKSKHLFIL